ncbi:T9SS type A sorting domain-containing protein [candidate division KSB1 bacterium]|nr:T9SS type A sorting domain-containing protein [candidate division KSB1 bacterium]
MAIKIIQISRLLSITLLGFMIIQPVFAQWNIKMNGLPDDLGAGFTIDTSKPNSAIISVSSQHAMFQTIDGGETWQTVNLPSDVLAVTDISMYDNNHIWICSVNGLIYSTVDGGKTWDCQFDNPSVTDCINYIKMFDQNRGMAMADCLDPVVNPEGPAIFLRTEDGGKNWVSMNDSAFGGGSGDLWRRVAFSSPAVGYFFESGVNPQTLYKTTDGGKTWHSLEFPENYITVLNFYNDNIGLACSLYYKVYQTLNGGKSWSGYVVSNDFSWGNDIEFAPNDPSKVWMTDNQKLYFSSDTGKTWTEQQSFGCRDISFIDDRNGFLLGDNIVYHTTNGGISMVHDYKSALLHTPVLFQNYPNPFNSRSTISFYIAEKSYIKLSIYNIIGENIITLADQDFLPGKHRILFNGEQLPSGTYIYKLEANNHVIQNKKLLLIR